MNFTNKSFSVIWKILLILVIASILIRIFPYIAVMGIILFAFVEAKKYFKNKKKVSHKMENMNNVVDNKDDPFNFSNKKIIDVEYNEVKK